MEAQGVSPLQFGAVGNGTNDDTRAINAAEAAAFAQRRTLVFPSGYNFTYNGSLTTRVDVAGYGATLTQRSAGEVAGGNISGTIKLSQTDDLMVAGLTINSNFKSTGLAVDRADNVRITDVTVRNCINMGIVLLS